MKVKVFSPAYFNIDKIDDDGFMELNKGATVNDVFKKLKIKWPIRRFIVFTLNGKQIKGNCVLKENDVINIFKFVSGG